MGFILDFYLFVLSVNSVVYRNLDSGLYMCLGLSTPVRFEMRF